jgi:Domain of Unknown Function (DUF1080)
VKAILTVFSVTIVLWSSTAVAATLRLSWQDTSSNESGFKIERLSGSSYVEVASVGPNVRSYSATTLASGRNYCFRVRAFNSAGISAPTNVGCATAPSSGGGDDREPPPPPNTTPPVTPPRPGPASLSANQWSDYQVRLSVRSNDNDWFGVMFRYQNHDNYYRFSWSAEDRERRLEKRVDGMFHLLARDTATYSAGRSYALQITARGSSLVVAIDGRTIFSVPDNTFRRGTMALYSNSNSGTYFDNIHVQDLQSGNTLASDDFSDGNHIGWTIIDEGTTGGPSRWAVRDGALAQSSNIAGSALGTYALYTSGSWTDYRMTLTMRSSDNDRLGVLFRFKDNNNHYRFLWNNQDGGRRLLKKVNGAFQVLAQDAVPYAVNRTYRIEIIAQGKTLRVNVDGRAVFAVADSSFSAGSVALYTSNNQSSHFDDVLVEDLKTKTVLIDEDFGSSNLTGWHAFDEPGTREGPSKWSVARGVLTQVSNIGSDATGFPGTFLLYY